MKINIDRIFSYNHLMVDIYHTDYIISPFYIEEIEEIQMNDEDIKKIFTQIEEPIVEFENLNNFKNFNN